MNGGHLRAFGNVCTWAALGCILVWCVKMIVTGSIFWGGLVLGMVGLTLYCIGEDG